MLTVAKACKVVREVGNNCRGSLYVDFEGQLYNWNTKSGDHGKLVSYLHFYVIYLDAF